jgi:S-adenosylmethionine decarboxylase proenzyme
VIIDTKGTHIVAELSGCNAFQLGSQYWVRAFMLEAAEAAGATVIHEHFHQFSPTGVSGSIIIAESHFSIHTWPEVGYASVDFYTCGAIDPLVACQLMFKRLGGSEMEVKVIKRGRFNGFAYTMDDGKPIERHSHEW